MPFSAIFLHNHPKNLCSRFNFLRRMGGGPRTFPGGLNKWQWKRLQEKKAREKEKRFLLEEKQVYQARIRSEIRAKLASAGSLNLGQENPNQTNPNYGPLSPQKHIKALADRFMKEGAEDLWNEDDGPRSIPANKPGRSLLKGESIDVQKLFAERSSYYNGNVVKPRSFSTYNGFGNACLRTVIGGFYLMGVSNRLNLKCYYSVGSAGLKGKSSDFVRKDLRNDGPDGEARSPGGKRAKWPRFRGGRMDSSDDDSDGSDEGEELEGSAKIVSSSAALGKYDIKKKRVPLKFLEGEGLSQQIELIRKEINERKALKEEEIEKGEEESLLSTKRFDECGISSLTVQALAEAGYVQMTTVQEVALSAFLEGRDALVKARAGTGKSIAFLF